VSEEELASLAVISPSKNGQYSGSRVKALIQALEQLEKQDLIKEFMVSSCYLLIQAETSKHVCFIVIFFI